MVKIVIQDGDLERMIEVPEAQEVIQWQGRSWRLSGDYHARMSFFGKESPSYALPNKPEDLPYYVLDEGE